jgi:hypothetical protein
MVKRIIQAGGWGRLKGVVWYQGESDAVEAPSAAKVYESSLGKFIDRLRIDTGNPDLPFIIVQIDRQVSTLSPGQPGKSKLGEEMADALATYTKAWEHVREVQRQMADKRKNVYLVSAIDLGDMVDPIHLEYESFRKLGRQRPVEVGGPSDGFPVAFRESQGRLGALPDRVRPPGPQGRAAALLRTAA